MISKDHNKFIEKMKSCSSCTLHQSRTQVVVGDYGPKNAVCFIGEAPGYNEDIQGRPFVGRSGKLLDKMLGEIGWTRSDVSVLNIAKCRPPNNRTPSNDEKLTCGTLWLTSQLEYLQPAIIVTLGGTALTYFKPGLRMTAAKGRIQETEYGIPLYPMFHPSYILRNGNKLVDAYRNAFLTLRKFVEGLHYGSEEVNMTESVKNVGQQSLEDFYS